MENPNPTPKTLGQIAHATFMNSPKGMIIRRKAATLQDFQHDVIAAIEAGEPIPLFVDAAWINDLRGYEKRLVWDPFKNWLVENDLAYTTIPKDVDFDLQIDFDHSARYDNEAAIPEAGSGPLSWFFHWNPTGGFDNIG